MNNGTRLRKQIYDDPEVRASLLARQWAQELDLPQGNLWEPAIARTVLSEYQRLGGDKLAWAAVEGIWRVRLGLLAKS